MTDVGPRPILITNPADDAAFRAAAEDAVTAGASTPEDLAAALRPAFALVTARARVLSGERDRIWYVYRDGSWVGRNRGHDAVSG